MSELMQDGEAAAKRVVVRIDHYEILTTFVEGVACLTLWEVAFFDLSAVCRSESRNIDRQSRRSTDKTPGSANGGELIHAAPTRTT